MKCERTECINVSNKIHRKKSHLLSLSFFLQIDCSHCFEVVQGAFSNGKALGTRQRGEVWRHVTMVAKFLDLTILLDRDGHLHHRTMEDHAIMHREVIHFMPYMFVFSCQICKFAFPLYRARSCITVILRADFDATVRLREVIALESQENRKQNKLNCCSEQLCGVLDCRCSSWQLFGMKGTTQASWADSTSAVACWHNFYRQDSATW